MSTKSDPMEGVSRVGAWGTRSFTLAAPRMNPRSVPSSPAKTIDVNDLPATERDAIARAIAQEGDPRVLCSLANSAASKGQYGVAARLAGAAAGIKNFFWYLYNSPASSIWTTATSYVEDGREISEEEATRLRRKEGIPAPDLRADHGGVRSLTTPYPSSAANLAYRTLGELNAIELHKFLTSWSSPDRDGSSVPVLSSAVAVAAFLDSLTTFKARYIALELQHLANNGGVFAGFATSPCNSRGMATIDEGSAPVTVAPIGGAVTPSGSVTKVVRRFFGSM